MPYKIKRVYIGTNLFNNTTDYRALKRAVEIDAKGNLSEWLRLAIREKLERDGYLTHNLPQGKLVK